jgi:hypothetical protein
MSVLHVVIYKGILNKMLRRFLTFHNTVTSMTYLTLSINYYILTYMIFLLFLFSLCLLDVSVSTVSTNDSVVPSQKEIISHARENNVADECH